MASLSVRCVLNQHPSIHLRRGADRPDPNPNPKRILPIGLSSSKKPPRISATTTATAMTPSVNRSSENKKVLFSERLDDWMRDSAAEIVRNLRKSPLLVQVYAADDGGAARLETEKAVSVEDWPAVTKRWKVGEVSPPDGVILVEEICGGDENENENGTKAWGVVVQGKGAKCGPVCYLLKTNRVVSGLGTGCTHFCLVRVQGFRESVFSQLTRCWLV
ncbi:GDSL esterase/lipase [Actinidia chinensis var. chinensis]|uniref:GDSL esterase/lipase n=1 Tax=Actinidia chinensis var. chinensis TaxID=1590841 RepID=A0A2R6RWK9_ACTCC|nr:GDSL esterase/lipase [Actinidia chinensis var. chinensis]